MNKETNKFVSEENVSFKTRIIGTGFIMSSGLLLYLDKFLIFLNIESSITFGYSNFSNFIWALMQSIAPILWMLGIYLRPYKLAFLVPLYSYGLQIIWIFSSEHSDEFLGHVFAIGVCVIFFVLLFMIKVLISRFGRKRNQEEEFVKEAKDVLVILKQQVLEGSKL